MTALCEDCQWLRLVFLFPGVLFLGISVFLMNFPPRKINWFAGYRTPRSMKNQTLWAAAQRYSGSLFRQTGLILLVVGIMQMVVFKEEIVWFSLAALPAGISIIFRTESYLKRVEEALEQKLPIPTE